MNTRNRIATSLVLFALACSLSLAGEGLKPLAPSDDFEQRILLQPTRYGRVTGMEGEAMVASKRGVHLIGISAVTKAEVAGLFVVVASTSERKYILGTMEFFLGTASLKLEYVPGDGNDLPAADRISHIQLEDADNVVLEGYFKTQPLRRQQPTRN